MLPRRSIRVHERRELNTREPSISTLCVKGLIDELRHFLSVLLAHIPGFDELIPRHLPRTDWRLCMLLDSQRYLLHGKQ
jgi:hypothetical protein